MRDCLTEKAIPEPLLTIFSIISTVCILGWILSYSRYGIDITDESFYLVWLSNPFIYSASVSQFGFIYHPLFLLLDGNIAALRQANIIITFCLAWFLVNTFFKVIAPEQPFGKWQQLGISSGFATASLLFLNTYWLPTPSYNSLALNALLIAATGSLLAEPKSNCASIFGWALIGIGGWLAFMAKPSTAAILALSAGIYLLTARKVSIHLLLFSIGTALTLLALSAFVIDGSITAFIQRHKIGIEFARDIGGGHTMAQLIRLDDFQLDRRDQILLVGLTVTATTSGILLQSKNRVMVLGAAALALGLASLILLVTLGITYRTLGIRKFQGLLIWAVPFAAILLGLFLYRREGISQILASRWALAVFLFMLPYAYAFGTGGNYWHAGCSAGLFWVLGGLVFLVPAIRKLRTYAMLSVLSIASQVVVAALVQTGLEAPYRQPQPLRLNNYPIDIGMPGSTLILSEGYGRYFAEAIRIGKGVGLKVGTPMIDLSGQSPGILYALQATNIGQAWMIGGYPGSNRLASVALRRVSCEQLAAAWILAEPNGPRRISEEILQHFGASFSKHYRIVASWETAAGAGGYEAPRLQQLLKPIRSEGDAHKACDDTRALES